MADDDLAALLARAEELVGVDRAASLGLVREIEHRLTRHHDGLLTGRTRFLHGTLLHSGGDFYRALAEFRSARRDWLAVGAGVEALRTTLGRARVLLDLGDFDEVVTLVGKLFDALGAVIPAPHQDRLVAGLHAGASHCLGIAHSGLGDHQQALRHFDVAANLYQAMGEEEELAVVCVDRGLALLGLGMAHRALAEMLAAHRRLAAAGKEQRVAACLVHVAEAYQATGQVTRAIQLLRAVGRRVDGLDVPPLSARLQLALGSALLHAGLAVEAHEHAQEAADTFADLAMIEMSGRAALLCAETSMTQDRLEVAVAELAGAERLFAECGALGMQARVWLDQAHLAERLGDRASALVLADRVLQTPEGAGHSVTGGYARLLVADLTDDPDLAEAHLAAVSDTAFTLSRRSLRLALAVSRARRYRRAGRTWEALENLRRAERLALAMERDNRDAQIRLVVRAQAVQGRDELIDLLLEHDRHTARIEAWQWASSSKARVLRGLVRPATGWEPESEAPEDDPAGAGDEVVDVVERLLDDEAARAAGVPLSSGDLGPDLPAVPEGPLLEYYILGDDLIAFVVREGQVHVRRLPGAAWRSRDLLTAWRQECALLVTGDRGSAPDASSPVLAELYTVLIDPVADLIDDIEAEPLVVVGHRHLYGVPFDALVDDRGRPLGARFDLCYTFGLSVLGDPEPRTAVAGGALVLAVPDDDAPLIRAEAGMVADHLPDTEVYVGARATSEVLLAKAAGRSVVHLACHGTFHPGNPFFSALRLGDRWLTARELIDADLSGVEVVLSACASGSVSEQDGEPIGLAWAVLTAGAAGVVAALWAVEDTVTYEFMELFYAAVAEGVPVRGALARARAELARRHPHPYHWAAFRYFCSDGAIS